MVTVFPGHTYSTRLLSLTAVMHNGHFIERVGFFNPIAKEGHASISDRIAHWVGQGATISNDALYVNKEVNKSSLILTVVIIATHRASTC